MSDCLFCRMASGDIKPDLVYEDEEIIAFRDINPQAPVHCLVIPRRHIAALDTLEPADAALLGRMFLVAKRLAAEQGLAAGYRTVINCREDGGQTVYHLHLHVLGGRGMTWPPG
ncbi:MAG: histidine triad nucleotide-binding protein [Gammaproteobacteria bacterium]|jgi:histidine triad (HIT) family protein|nr:histidine triad nucleotide-binding protein [Gammaproteobacteria bacterium]